MGQTIDQRELEMVRKRLDSLNSLRLSGPLNSDAQQAYRALCEREAELLHGLEMAE